jgi:hypothetical protein
MTWFFAFKMPFDHMHFHRSVTISARRLTSGAWHDSHDDRAIGAPGCRQRRGSGYLRLAVTTLEVNGAFTLRWGLKCSGGRRRRGEPLAATFEWQGRTN